MQTVDGESLRQFAAFIGKMRVQVDIIGLTTDEVVDFREFLLPVRRSFLAEGAGNGGGVNGRQRQQNGPDSLQQTLVADDAQIPDHGFRRHPGPDAVDAGHNQQIARPEGQDILVKAGGGSFGRVAAAAQIQRGKFQVGLIVVGPVRW